MGFPEKGISSAGFNAMVAHNLHLCCRYHINVFTSTDMAVAKHGSRLNVD
jgi:hypothetical protein